MSQNRVIPGAALLLALAALGSAAENRWRIQYFHDDDQSELTLVDLKFRSTRRGMAAGAIESKHARQNVILVTSNGGKNWDTVKFREEPVSLFLLDDSIGWVVTPKGLWRTEESGRVWKKVSNEKGLTAVHFVSPQKGWAAGSEKRVLGTEDGGKTWTAVAAVEKLPGTPALTVFDVISFSSPKNGMILGWNRPASTIRGEAPGWLEPGLAAQRRELPHLILAVETRDGGATWSGTSASVFGQITRMRLGANGRDLALIEYRRVFQSRSDVLSMDLRNSKAETVYRATDRAVTDLLRAGAEGAVLAGVEALGKLPDSPIPTKVHFLISNNLKEWKEMPVDYRAVARRVVLAGDGAGEMWAATDTGMILHWTPAGE